MLSRRVFIVIALVAVAGLAGGGVLLTHKAAAPDYQTRKAALGTVTQTVSLAGNVAPVGEVDLDFGTSGKVASIDVAVGQQVTAGETLAGLDTSSLQGALTQAQATLASVQAKLQLDQAGPTQQNLEAANASVASAQAGLASARTSLSDTQAVNAESITQAQDALTAAENTVAADQQKLSTDQAAEQSACGSSPPASDCQQDQQTVASDQQTLTRDQGTESGDAAALTMAQLHAQQSDDQAQAQVNSATVQLQNAQSSLSALEAGATAEQITMDQSQVTIDQVTVANAQRSLSDAVLVAPGNGIVGAVNVSDGQSVTGSSGSGSGTSGSSSSSSSSSAATTHDIAILTPGAFEVTGSVSDAQVSQIALNQRARITPAGATQALDGRVTAIAEEATISSGVASFPVTVTLTSPAPALRSGMSATVSVVVNQVVDVLTVPTGAVHTAAGTTSIQLLVNGAPQTVPVQVGASDADLTQILSGNVNPGDDVVIAIVSSQLPSSSSGNGFFPGGGGTRGGGGGAGRFTGGGG